MLMVIPSFLLVAMIVRAAGGESGWLMLIFALDMQVSVALSGMVDCLFERDISTRTPF